MSIDLSGGQLLDGRNTNTPSATYISFGSGLIESVGMLALCPRTQNVLSDVTESNLSHCVCSILYATSLPGTYILSLIVHCASNPIAPMNCFRRMVERREMREGQMMVLTHSTNAFHIYWIARMVDVVSRTLMLCIRIPETGYLNWRITHHIFSP